MSGTQLHVLNDGHLGQALCQLEGSHHSHRRRFMSHDFFHASSVKTPLPCVGSIKTGEQVEQRCLARPIGSNQRSN